MKKLLVICVVFLACQASVARVPNILSYQGVLRDSGGTPVPDDTYSVTFAIYDVSVGGTELWSETQSLPVTDGIVNANLGSVVPLGLPFDEDYWLGISVAGETELTPRVRLTAAPYAVRAAMADTVEGLGDLTLPYDGGGTLGYGPLFKVTNQTSTGSAVYGRNASTERFGYLGGESYGVYGERYVEYGATRGHLGGGSYGAYGVLDAGFGVYHSGYLGGSDYGVYGEFDSGPVGGGSEGGLAGTYGVYGSNEGMLGGVNWGYLAGSTYGVYGEHSSGRHASLAGPTYAVYGNSGGSGYAGGFDGDVLITGTATVDDVLRLVPRSSFPSSPEEGTLCIVGDPPESHIYVYMNEGWRQLDPVGK